jgi:SAM-dependent methyltransferase
MTTEALPGAIKSASGNFRRGAKPAGHQLRRQRAVSRLLAGCTGNVLDYGCGYGDISYLISRSHFVIGCDVDPDRVAFAASEYSPIQFTQCGPHGTSFDGATFDIVVSVVVIHFVPDAGRYLDEVHRLLKAGGSLILLCQNQPVLRDALRRLFRKGKAPTRLWVPTITQMNTMLAASGFEILKSTFFYDPPFESWRNPGDWIFGGVKQLLSIFQVFPTSDYYGYVARKCSK